MKDIVIIGAGLSGSLLAIRLAQRGYKVDIYEKRPDLRKTDISAGRSINLALSDRGLRALATAGIEEEVHKLTIPMHGRMIHGDKGKTRLFKYSGRPEEWIYSISRPGLNGLLMNKAESYDDLNIIFEYDAIRINSRKNEIQFKTPKQTVALDVSDKIVIGADGAGSAMRREFQRRSNEIRFNFSQQFLNTGYKELCLPAGHDQSFQIEKNALHIWPRNGFMMIALPNLDGSFTVTLFMPFKGEKGFDNINDEKSIRELFEQNFADVIQFFPDFQDQYQSNPSSSLGTIRCQPWQLEGQYLLIGDAAHAIVPFYGQGMNCSFEDVRILDECIAGNEGKWKSIFKEYQSRRKPDTDAIASLAEDNFYEMRDSTADPVFNRKREIELTLEQRFPEYYSKYSLVTFKDDIPYSEAMSRGRKQDAYLMVVAAGIENVKQIDPGQLMDDLRNRFEWYGH